MKAEETSAVIQIQHYTYILKSKLYLVLTFLFLGLGFAAIYAFFIVPPQYESTVQMITQTSNPEGNNNVGLNDLNANILLVNTYKDMIHSNKLLIDAQSQLKKNDIDLTLTEMRQMIHLQQSQNSQMFELKVVNSDPRISKLVSETVTSIFQKEAANYTGNEKIKIVSPARLAEKPISPNPKLILMIGGILGFVLSILIIFLLELTNNTINSSEFLTDEVGIPILGTLSGVSQEQLEEGQKIDFSYYRQNPRQFKKDFYPKKRARKRRRRRKEEFRL